MDALVERLQPVLGPAVAKDEVDANATEPIQSLLARRLNHVNLGLKMLNERITETLGRLEL
jgi:hypothetical protein